MVRLRICWEQQVSTAQGKLRDTPGTGLNQQTGAGGQYAGLKGRWAEPEALGGAAAGEGPDSSVPSPEAALWGAHASGGPHSPAAHKPATPAARPPRSSRGSFCWWRPWSANTRHTPCTLTEPGCSSPPGRYGKALGQKSCLAYAHAQTALVCAPETVDLSMRRAVRV